MNMERLCVSLETAKKLKAAKFPQRSQFYWVITMTTNYHLSWYEGELPDVLKERNDCYAAPTAQEIMDQLKEFHKPIELMLFGFHGPVSASLSRRGIMRQDAEVIVEALAALWFKLNV
jgi:hypothetical protein